MKILAAIFCLLASAADLPPSIRPIVETARSTTPEFFADTVARLVESQKIPDKAQRIDLLEQAFEAAANAKELAPLIAVEGTPPDTRAMYRGKAGELHLDVLSLQSRILKLILAIDAPKARELFDQMARPADSARGCENPLLPDFSPYYLTAGTIAQSAFTPAEKQKQIHVQFLMGVLSQAKSPAELAAFAMALESVSLTPAQLELLLASISKAMESMSGYLRSFENSVDRMQAQMEALTARAAAAHVSSEGLLKAYRTFLVAQLTAPRCSEDLIFSPKSAIAWISARTTPLAAEETAPGKTVGSIQASAYFQSADAQQLGNELRQLLAADHSAPDWPGRLSDFLRDYTAWTPPGDEIDVFHQRATILRALLQTVPSGEDRDGVIALCAELLSGSDAERSSPAEWLWQAKTLLEAAGQDAPKMRQAFRASGDAALALYE